MVDGWIRNWSGWELEEDDGNIDCVVFETVEEEPGFYVTEGYSIWSFDITKEK